MLNLKMFHFDYHAHIAALAYISTVNPAKFLPGSNDRYRFENMSNNTAIRLYLKPWCQEDDSFLDLTLDKATFLPSLH
jgi:hypothetical protein